jgi:predicted transposase/invertase (TIGR01784 family)
MSIANTDEQMRYELLARDMFLSDLATDLDAAENKGRQEGRQEGKIEIALKMIAKGRSFEEISDITELSTDQVKKLAENNKVSEPATKYKAKRKTTKPRKK